MHCAEEAGTPSKIPVITMINYSLAMRSVNANLLEINQAKSRVKAAQLKGESPLQSDLDLIATEKQKAFAVAQYAEVMSIEKFAKHIATHGCVYSRADINAILYMAVDCMREQLLEGKKIRLGDLGDFYVSLTSKGADDPNTFTAQNITGIRVLWDPGMEFKNLLTDAEFNLVASRAAQAKVIKAIKSGESVVDLNTTDPENPDGGGSAGGSDNPSGGSNENPSGGSDGGGSVTNYTVTLSANDDSMGNVTGAGSYAAGSTVTISAVPASGYVFQTWSDGNTSATRSLTVDRDYTLTATFQAESSGGEDPETPPFS